MRKLFLAAALAAVSSAASAAGVDAGRYQSVLGDCEGCHGKNLAGGVELMTPFGKLVAPNITPDKQTGIGNYSGEDFRLEKSHFLCGKYAVLRKGKRDLAAVELV